MSTVAEIESALDQLEAEPLRAVLRHALARMNRLMAPAYYSNDRWGTVTEDDIIAEADGAFTAYDFDEETK